jgi:hypothetical protein
VNDTGIAFRAAAMQSSDPRGVSVAQERPERSAVPADLAQSGNPLLPGEIRNRRLAAFRVRTEGAAFVSRASGLAMAEKVDSSIGECDERLGAGGSPQVAPHG